MRIISLLPSATEILFDLGLGDRVAGVTFECDFPSEAKSKRIVSTSALPENLTPAEIDLVVKARIEAGEDLYRLDRGAFAELDPDLVITQDLCAVCAVDVSEVDDALAYLACTADVVTLDPMTLGQVIESINTVGASTGASDRAVNIIADLEARLEQVSEAVADAERPKVLVLEWTDPAFTAGHWVPDLVEQAGGTSVLGRPGENSVGVEWETIRSSDADVIIVSPCGYRLDGAADLGRQLLDRAVLPDHAQVWAIDADAYMVRPGPRVVEGVEVLASIFHPKLVGAPDSTKAMQLRSINFGERFAEPDSETLREAIRPVKGFSVMTSPNTSSSTAFALLATLAAAALWAVLAWRTPTSTFHFAPLIAVAVGPYIAKARSGPLTPAAAAPVVGVCFAATAVAVAVLAVADRMRGPTFWSEDGATLEAALFTVVGAIIGFRILSRGSQPS